MSDRGGAWLEAAENALRAAPPEALLPTARKLLATQVQARYVTLLLADYGLTELHPVTTPTHTTHTIALRDGAPAARAFVAGATTLEADVAGTVTLHLPVTVRGDRLGVLSVNLPKPSLGLTTVMELRSFATAMGHELVIADRHTDLYLRARRRQRLTLAAEMQWQLLPGRGFVRDEYTLGAHVEPAYAVGGDNFDWSTSDDHLTITVTNGSGHGLAAALLTNLTVSALRNARRAGVSLADQACLADQAIYGEYSGRRCSPTLLLRFNLATGEASVVDAGSPQLFRLRNGTVERVDLEAQLPLGMFEETDYREQPLGVAVNDRLVIATSGPHSTRTPGADGPGEDALLATIVATRDASPHEAARILVEQLMRVADDEDLPGDAAVVCLDWRGRA
ncbi:PP2C family protein-serine/threonine phosphatase [Streptomyces sp. NPDC056121]|uniref:PP2C family protein-serine/threonine phosphatase n=1 Tax=unclassified Streptomyces TaxID=2593676 RepID=UPI0035E1A27A